MNDATDTRFEQYRQRLAELNDIAALMTVQELGVFQALLDGPKTLEALGGLCAVSPRRLGPMLEVVSHSGFLRIEGDGYALVDGDAPLFKPGGRYWSRLSGAHTVSLFNRYGSAERVLREDRPFEAASTGGSVDAAARDDFLSFFDAWAREPARKVADAACGETFSSLVDLGCGGGTYGFAMLAKMPGARATLVDRDNAADTVSRLAEEAGVSDRVRFLPADVLDCPDVGVVDLVFSSNLVHCYGFRDNLKLAAYAAEILAPGGRLMIKDYIPSGKARQTREMSRFAMQLALFSESGQLYDESAVQLWMAMSGLRHEITHDLGDSYLVVARKPE